MDRTAPRYAVYWTPDTEHPLWRAGGAWFGQDRLRAVAPADLIGTPRRYGFHATLKAPMRLRQGSTPADLIEVARALAARQRAFDMPQLAVAWLGDFLALRPASQPEQQLQLLADDCVRQFDPLRDAPTAAELHKHCVGAHVDAAHEARVRRWGYPHVFEHWRCHLTLAQPLPVADGEAGAGADTVRRHHLEQLARAHFSAALRAPLRCDALCLYVEPAPGEAFERLARFGFGS